MRRSDIRGNGEGARRASGDPEPQETAQVPSEEPAGAGAAPADSVADPAAPAEAVEPVAQGNGGATAEQTAVELGELRDRHLRLMAEFENYRKRTQREQADLRRNSQADLMLRILPTLDDMTRVASIPNDQTTVEALDEGILLIRRNLMKELEALGLERIQALDAPFDPEFHQAVLRAQVDDPSLDNTVSRVFVEGYVLGDRLVRPAQVEVRQLVSPTD